MSDTTSTPRLEQRSTIRVERPGVTLDVEVGPDNGPTVLFVHGYPDTRQTWTPIADRLQSTHRVAMFDTRGAGRSTDPATRDGYDLDLLASDIDAVIDELGGPVHLVGHDWGSVECWHYLSCLNRNTPAARTSANPLAHPRPERVLSYTTISGPHLGVIRSWLETSIRGGVRSSTEALRQLGHSWYMFAFKTPALPEIGVDRFGLPIRRLLGVPLPSDVDTETVLRSTRNGLEIYRQNFHPFDPSTDAVPDDGSFPLPVLAIVPTDDPYVTPRVHATLHQFVPNLTRVDLAAGHWVMHEQPDVVAELISDFATTADQQAANNAVAVPLTLRRGRVDGADGSRPRLVLITGAGSGIGRSTALAFAERGDELILCDIDASGLDRSASMAAALSGQPVHQHIVDVADPDAMAQLADTVHATLGSLDVLVNNAGVGLAGSIMDTSVKDWDWIVGINLTGVFLGCRLFGERMAAAGRGGSIINIASAAGFTPSAALPIYATTKSAVIAFSESLGAELHDTGVSVSAVCPGIVKTNITEATRYSATLEADDLRSTATAAYARRNYSPDKVAARIVRAVDRPKAIIPVSPEARVLRLIGRASTRLSRRLARLDPAEAAASVAAR